MVNAILYLLRTGCSWRQLPKDFPPWETVYWHFKRWRDDGSLDALHDTLRERVREAEGRDAQPTAAIIDALVLVTAANVQDRDGAQPALAAVRKAFPTISLVWADGGYAGKLVEWAKQTARIVLEIVRKPEGQRTFEVLPRRWWSSARCRGSPNAGDWTTTTNGSPRPRWRWSNGRWWA